MKDEMFVKIAKALADPTRRRMLDELRGAGADGLTCSCMCARFPLSQPTISHHVKTLEEAGLVSVRKEGQFHVLSVKPGVLEDFATTLVGGAGATRGGARAAGTRARAASGASESPVAARPRRTKAARKSAS